MTVIKPKKKYLIGPQWKGNKSKSAGDNPQNNSTLAKKRNRLGMTPSPRSGVGHK